MEGGYFKMVPATSCVARPHNGRWSGKRKHEREELVGDSARESFLVVAYLTVKAAIHVFPSDIQRRSDAGEAAVFNFILWCFRGDRSHNGNNVSMEWLTNSANVGRQGTALWTFTDVL